VVVDVNDALVADGLTLRMRRGLSVRGRVVGPDGAPVAGSNVAAEGEGPAGNVTTYADGSFTLQGLNAGPRLIVAGAPAGLAPGFVLVEVSPERPNAGVEIVLARAAAVRGRLLGPDGEPLFYTTVTSRQPVGNTGFRDGPRTDTDESGRFELRPLRPGRVVIEGAAQGLKPFRRELELGSGEVATLDVTLESGSAISGRLEGFAPTGRLLDLAFVRCRRVGREPWDTAAPVKADGTFSVGGLDEGERYDLSVGVAGFTGAVARDVPAGTSDLVLAVKRHARLNGRIAAPGGPPAPEVWWQTEKGAGPEGLSGGHEEVDATGRFSLSEVDPDVDRIRLWVEGFPALVIEKPALAPGEERDVVLSLEEGGIVEGLVVDAARRPVAGARVGASIPGEAGARLPPELVLSTGPRSDLNGGFRHRTAAGPVAIWATASSYELATVERIEVPRGGVVRGVVIELRAR
jgi:hypothetical protein